MKDKFSNPVVRLLVGGNLPNGHKSAGYPTRIRLYQVISVANFASMFGEVCHDTGKICLTDKQSISACKTYPGWIRKSGQATFIVSKADGRRAATPDNLIVTMLSFRKRKLQVRFAPFTSKRVFPASRNIHLVVWKASS